MSKIIYKILLNPEKHYTKCWKSHKYLRDPTKSLDFFLNPKLFTLFSKMKNLSKSWKFHKYHTQFHNILDFFFEIHSGLLCSQKLRIPQNPLKSIQNPKNPAKSYKIPQNSVLDSVDSGDSFKYLLETASSFKCIESPWKSSLNQVQLLPLLMPTL